jgi:hypothetical protein
LKHAYTSPSRLFRRTVKQTREQRYELYKFDVAKKESVLGTTCICTSLTTLPALGGMDAGAAVAGQVSSYRNSCGTGLAISLQGH